MARYIDIDPRFMYWAKAKGGTTVAIPFPSFDSGVFEVSRAVSSGRNANGAVVGQMVWRSVSKQNMSWTVLPNTKWWEMNQFVESNGMFFWCHYFDHSTGVWRDRKFYCGDFSCQPFGVNPSTGVPQFYRNCSVNVIDMGE